MPRAARAVVLISGQGRWAAAPRPKRYMATSDGRSAAQQGADKGSDQPLDGRLDDEDPNDETVEGAETFQGADLAKAFGDRHQLGVDDPDHTDQQGEENQPALFGRAADRAAVRGEVVAGQAEKLGILGLVAGEQPGGNVVAALNEGEKGHRQYQADRGDQAAEKTYPSGLAGQSARILPGVVLPVASHQGPLPALPRRGS
jgi:hypothetical protein